MSLHLKITTKGKNKLSDRNQVFLKYNYGNHYS